jgi:hypothetical protein
VRRSCDVMVEIAAITMLGMNLVPRAVLNPRVYAPKNTPRATSTEAPVNVALPVLDERLLSASTAITANMQERATALNDSTNVGECPEIAFVHNFTMATIITIDVAVAMIVFIGAITTKNINATMSNRWSMWNL